MERKVAQTELNPGEYENLLTAARKNGISIKEALRQAALRWVAEESGINPQDPIFDIALGRKKLPRLHLKGEALRRARKASEEIDSAAYGETRPAR